MKNKKIRIISWNCQGAYRKKEVELLKLKPDIAIIQECEQPDKFESQDWRKMKWYGDGKKGVGIFCYHERNAKIELAGEIDPSIRHCIPLQIQCKGILIELIAVWAMNHPDRNLSYVSQVYRAIKKYSDLLANERALVIGDFNGNTIWDRSAKHGCMSDVVRTLKAMQMKSIYHSWYKEEFGEERQSTFFMHRKPEKGYHIDYCFVPHRWLPYLTDFYIGDFQNWRRFSDHSPLHIELELEKIK